MRRVPLRPVFTKRQKADNVRWTLQRLKSVVLKRLVQLSTPTAVAASANSFYHTEWSWVGLAALVHLGETKASIESVVKALVEDKLIIQRTKKDKLQISLA